MLCICTDKQAAGHGAMVPIVGLLVLYLLAAQDPLDSSSRPSFGV